MSLQAYFKEYKSSWLNKLRAKIAYVFLRTDHKLMAELPGRILVGAYHYADMIALNKFYQELEETTGRSDIEIRIEALEKAYRTRKNVPMIRSSSKENRLNILETLCQSHLFSMNDEEKTRIIENL